MSEPKTKANDQSVDDYLANIIDDNKRNDCLKISMLMKEATGEKPTMWGDSIVGFGSYHYVYASGREGTWPLTGFAPRKQNISLYIMTGFIRFPELMAQLGKHKTGKSCLYINKLADIDINILSELIKDSVQYMKDKYHK